MYGKRQKAEGKRQKAEGRGEKGKAEGRGQEGKRRLSIGYYQNPLIESPLIAREVAKPLYNV
jgi:hypothetical protein